METKWKLIHYIRKRELGFLGNIMREECLENLIFTGQIDGKRDKGLKGITQ